MGTKANPTVIGAFIVGAVVLIIAAVLVFGKSKLFTETSTIVMYFEGSVNGLNAGAPVKFRGVEIGSVLEVQALYNPEDYTGQVKVVAEIEPSRFSEVVDGVIVASSTQPRGQEEQATMVKRGIRAQLQMQSFVTGLLYVALDFHPDTPIRLSGIQSAYPEVPTIPTKMEEVAETVRHSMQQLSELPLEPLLQEVSVTFQRVNALLSGEEVNQALVALASLLQGADQGVVDLRQRVPQLLDQFGGAATAATAALETAQTTLSDVQQVVQQVGGQMGPLIGHTQKTVTTARGALQQAQQTLKTLETKASPALGEAERAFAAAANVAGADSVIINDLSHSLTALEEAARSIRLLADYLQRNPEALLRGKGRAGGQ
jgi:paraquat-inducible protein B